MKVVLLATLAVLLAGCSAMETRGTPQPLSEELYRVNSTESILTAARALIESDGWAALVTVDGQGQPRVRTVGVTWSDVDANNPRKNMTLWVMTRNSTRKIAQIKDHPQATLYFSDDEKYSYLSIMGEAVIHTNPADPYVKPHIKQEHIKYFWPDFPKGFVMLEIQPRWIEFMGPGIPNNKEHWRPQGVVIP